MTADRLARIIYHKLVDLSLISSDEETSVLSVIAGVINNRVEFGDVRLLHYLVRRGDLFLKCVADSPKTVQPTWVEHALAQRFLKRDAEIAAVAWEGQVVED